MKQKKKSPNKIIQLVLLVVLIVGISYMQKNNSDKKSKNQTEQSLQNKRASATSEHDINKLTKEDIVVDYIKTNGKLPDYYLTKQEAQKRGWVAVKGNLCEVLPGKAIGGDYFGNREGLLPSKNGRKYYEADLNYNCGKRNSDRLIYSSDGLIFITKDHYKSFQQQ